jgi:integrase
MAKGIEERHARSCRSQTGGRCNCEPTYRPYVWNSHAQAQIRGRPTKSPAEAASWRRDALIAIRRGRAVDLTAARTLREAATEWFSGARDGSIRTRSGERYKPSAIRSYDRSLRLRVLDTLGGEPLGDIRRADLQELVERLGAQGLAESTIEATIIPVRAIFRRELERDRLKVNPTVGLSVPHSRRRRERIATPGEAAALLAALSDRDRAVWATALYAGLRRGELRALRVERVDLDAEVIHVEHGWDDLEGEIDTKGRNRRRVPIPRVLARELRAHLLRTGRRDSALIFGDGPGAPFNPKRLTERADEAWTAAKLNRITLHECRHAYASLMIAAGVNAKALCDYMGHSSITVTYDRYGHLMPGSHAEAAGLLDAFLDRAIAVNA